MITAEQVVAKLAKEIESRKIVAETLRCALEAHKSDGISSEMLVFGVVLAASLLIF